MPAAAAALPLGPIIRAVDVPSARGGRWCRPQPMLACERCLMCERNFDPHASNTMRRLADDGSTITAAASETRSCARQLLGLALQSVQKQK